MIEKGLLGGYFVFDRAIKTQARQGCRFLLAARSQELEAGFASPDSCGWFKNFQLRPRGGCYQFGLDAQGKSYVAAGDMA
jgi:hypothetical protein